jgi:hypothetical protein
MLFGITVLPYLGKLKTSEFWLTVLGCGFLCYDAFLSTRIATNHAIGILIVLSAYMIARSFFKRSRTSSIGFLTSEFYFLIAGVVVFFLLHKRGQLESGHFILFSAILIGAYILSRGNTKRLEVRAMPFLLFFLLISPANAEEYKYRFNPFTNRMDIVVNISSTSVGSLIDVSTATIIDGQCLVWSSASSSFQPGSCAATTTGALLLEDGGILLLEDQ